MMELMREVRSNEKMDTIYCSDFQCGSIMLWLESSFRGIYSARYRHVSSQFGCIWKGFRICCCLYGGNADRRCKVWANHAVCITSGGLTQEYLFLDPEQGWYIRNEWQWGGFVITASAEAPTLESLGLTELQASIPDMKLMPYDQACYDSMCRDDRHPAIEPGENQYYLQIPSDDYLRDYDTISTLLRQNESLEQVQDFYLFIDGRKAEERYFSRGSLSCYSAEQLDLQQEAGLEDSYTASEQQDGTTRYAIRCETIGDLVRAVSCLEQCDAISKMQFFQMGSAYMLGEISSYPGDVDNDQDITLSDATAILTKYTETAVGGTYTFPIEDSLQALAQFNADYNGDGIIDLEDATAVLTKYCESAVKK